MSVQVLRNNKPFSKPNNKLYGNDIKYICSFSWQGWLYDAWKTNCNFLIGDTITLINSKSDPMSSGKSHTKKHIKLFFNIGPESFMYIKALEILNTMSVSEPCPCKC